MHFHTKAFIYLALVALFCPVVINAQKSMLKGGGINILVPFSGVSDSDFGFYDVAKVGGGINVSTIWFFNPQLSIGSELGYSYFPKNKKTWNQQSKGDIKVNYQILNLAAQGNFYFNEGKSRPYIGVAFGLYYLRNMLNFDSKYTGTTNDASVSYVSNTFHAGLGPEIGIMYRINKGQYATFGLRYTIIPDIEAEYYPEDKVTINPHDKQNHWGLSAKLFFSSK